MARPTFGRPIRAAILDPRRAILAQCHEPRATTTDRLAGRPTPCYRCLAFTTAQACHFTTREELRA